MSSVYFRRLPLLAMCTVLAMGLSPTGLRAAPTITALAVQPATLEVGKPFTLAVTASADTTQGTATVDFRPWAARVMRVTLAKQGGAMDRHGHRARRLAAAFGGEGHDHGGHARRRAWHRHDLRHAGRSDSLRRRHHRGVFRRC